MILDPGVSMDKRENLGNDKVFTPGHVIRFITYLVV
jgi:hypothetical protein